MIIAAVECVGARPLGRIRLRPVRTASAAPLEAFIADAVEPEATVRTDDWPGYRGLAAKGYAHRPTPMRSPSKSTDVVRPRVPLVFSLLKRWLLSRRQGAVRHSHPDCYLDEFTFRFNRRTSASRGKLFFRLLQHAAEVEPHPYRTLHGAKNVKPQQDAAT